MQRNEGWKDRMNPTTFASSSLVVGLGRSGAAADQCGERRGTDVPSPRILSAVATISTKLHISLLSLNGPQRPCPTLLRAFVFN